MPEINDPDGKSFFLVPAEISRADLQAAVLLTYVLNAGTGYADAGRRSADDNDFPDTPYSAAEVGRIRSRQHANRWSYAAGRAVRGAGGSLVTTPNGMLMGIAGSRVHSGFSRRGGTAYGDLFLVNIGGAAEPATALSRIVRSGHAWFERDDSLVAYPRQSLDRLLHHEERHARQWADLGPARMAAQYLAEEARVRIFGGFNRFEEDAGLRDGGYR